MNNTIKATKILQNRLKNYQNVKKEKCNCLNEFLWKSLVERISCFTKCKK